MSKAKNLGDAGEYYALSQFAFNEKFGAKMPDNWQSYDLIIENNDALLKVSVKTRSETSGWKTSKWFQWKKEDKFDLLVLIFKNKNGELTSWIIPKIVADKFSSKPNPSAINQSHREISWKTLEDKLEKYKNNWKLAM